MLLQRHRLTLRTTAPIAFVDLTAEVGAWVRASGVRDGLLTVTTQHTTARLTVNEREARLQDDMGRFLAQLAPAGGPYRHNEETVDGRPNAHAHLLGLLLSATETIPVVGGALQLGAWQALFLVELDGPRPERSVHLQVMGTAA
jgi:secondary thiamine-phosphate synthase enzyme